MGATYFHELEAAVNALIDLYAREDRPLELLAIRVRQLYAMHSCRQPGVVPNLFST